jgi:putative addiction module CopG family antidote
MRSTTSISLPPALKKELDQYVKAGMYASTSELFRNAIRELRNKMLVRELRASQQAAKAGKLYKLASLRELRS